MSNRTVWMLYPVLIAWLALAGPVRAASPSLARIVPPGGQRGTEVDVVLSGARLADAEEIVFYTRGLRAMGLEAAGESQVKATIRIDADAELGEHALRLRTASGISELRTFQVGALRVVAEAEPNNDFQQPQKIELDVTVAGVVSSEDVDYYAVEARKGERITAEVEGMRLGMTMFDPYVAIMDENRFELAACDDSALLLQDAVASIIAPADGTYIIQVRESAYGGSDACHYRLHVGSFPRPRAVFPPGGPAGEELEVEFVGDVAGPIRKKLKLPEEATERLALYAEQDGLTAPSPNPFRVSAFGNVIEAEPNDSVGSATAVGQEAPVALNGIISADGDYDFYRFRAGKGQTFDVHIYARRLRSPLDPVMNILDSTGRNIAANDDAGGPDSYLRFSVPEDGEYIVRVRDYLRRGGPEFVYRIEITPVAPALSLTIPEVVRDSQERQAMAVPRGNRFGALLRATRQNFGGDLVIEADGLPEGVRMHAPPVAANTDLVPVIFEAEAEAPVAGALAAIRARHVDEQTGIAGGFSHAVPLIVGAPNNTTYYSTTVDRLAVAVTEEAPFSLRIIEPKAPLVQNGSMGLRVVAERKEGFAGAIAVRLLYNPPGIGASSSINIAAEKEEATIPLSAAGNAQTRVWPIAVIGSSDVRGVLWVASEFASLTVAPPLATVKIEMASVEQGGSVEVACAVDQKTPFEGRAKVQLRGLPANTTAEEVEITSEDRTLSFTVKTSEKSPPGQHKSLYCQLVVEKDGEPIVHNTGHGGVLRIDPPPKKTDSSAEKTEPAAGRGA